MIPYILTALGGYLIGSSVKQYASGGQVQLLAPNKLVEENGQVQLLAPNGKPSNLTPEQYKLVRTPEFKAWFGDWEKDPENASKVVDENGEPMVVYHGTFRKFNIFENSREGGYFFTEFKRIAEIYANYVREGKLYYDIVQGTPRIISAFLNIRKIHKETIYGIVQRNASRITKTKKKGFDGLILKGGQDVGGYYDQYVAFEPNQIKLADGTNTTFDGSNPDIRYEEGGKIKDDIIKPKPKIYTIGDYEYDLRIAQKWLTDRYKEVLIREGETEEQIEKIIKQAQNEVDLLTSRTPFTTWYLDIPKGKYKFEVAGALYEIKKDVRQVDLEIGWKRLKQNKNFWYVLKINSVETPFDKYIAPHSKYTNKAHESDSKELLITRINNYFRNLIFDADISNYPLPDVN